MTFMGSLGGQASARSCQIDAGPSRLRRALDRSAPGERRKGIMAGVVIDRGVSERDRRAVVAMLREYEAGLGISLCFQDFDAEIAGLPGAYAPPGGQMLLARDRHGESIGIVALRPVADLPAI